MKDKRRKQRSNSVTSVLNHVIIIGAMKAGTTSLFEWLRMHGQICASVIKEAEFFSRNCPLDINEYSRLFEWDKELHEYTLEASPGYSRYPQFSGVPERMVAYGISPIIIYIVRNPYDRIVSHYNYMLRTSPSFYQGKQLANDNYINASKYYMQIQPCLIVYPNRNNYHIIDFDDLVNNPRAVVNGILDKLGLAPFRIILILRQGMQCLL